MLLLLMSALVPSAEPAPISIEVVVRNVTLYDGSGKPGRKGDIALGRDRIVAIGTFEVTGKPRIIDGAGLIAAPGFIDLHNHADIGSPSIIAEEGRAIKCYLMQGVTLVVTGNCGSGPTDVKSYFAKLEKNGVGAGIIHQIPHNSVRAKVMGNANRIPTEDELHKMEEIVEQQMNDGCWGLSTGLIYTPGTYAKTPELITLAKVAAKHGGFYASHIRSEGAGVSTAIEEAIKIGREAGLPVHISHIKCFGRGAWGLAGEVIGMIEKARRDGVIVTADQYPYLASSTSLSATVIPTRFRDGTNKDYRDRLDDPEKGPAIRAAVEAAMKSHNGGETIQIAGYKSNPSWQGKTIAAIAVAEKKTPADIVLEIERHGGAGVVNFGMNEEDVRLFMKQPFVATASDGSSHVPGDTVPHPRSYGTFPRKIGRYGVDDGVISLEQAIRSASGLPADILRLTDRGYLKPGYFADVVVFDPKTYRDLATYDKPHQYATGVKYLFVNGKLAIDEGKFLDVLAGKPLRHPEPVAPVVPAPPADITAKAWTIIDGKTGKPLWGFHETEARAIASTTKIMTAWIILQGAEKNPKWLDEDVRFSERAAATPGSSCRLKVGERVTARELLYGLLLPSGNDAAVALAEHFGSRLQEGDPAKMDGVHLFVAEMNRQAKSLKLSETKFLDPNGLARNEASARDLAALTWHAMQNKQFREYVKTREHECEVSAEGETKRRVTWKNTNRLLEDASCDGVKTGTTNAAGACLVASAHQGADHLMVVILGSTSGDSRYEDARKLLRWAADQRKGKFAKPEESKTRQPKP